MSHLSKRAVDILLSHKRNSDPEDEDARWNEALDAVAWAYLVAREACDEAEQGAADAVAAKSDYDSESADGESSTDAHERVLGGTTKADLALFAAAAALNDATSTLQEHADMYSRLEGFVFATAKYTYETADAAKIANEAWEAVHYGREDEDD